MSRVDGVVVHHQNGSGLEPLVFPQQHRQALPIDRLGHVLGSAQPEALHPVLDDRDNDHRNVGGFVIIFQGRQHPPAVDVRHHHIQGDDGRAQLLDHLQGCRAGGDDMNGEALMVEEALHQLADLRVVIDHQHDGPSAAGGAGRDNRLPRQPRPRQSSDRCGRARGGGQADREGRAPADRAGQGKIAPQEAAQVARDRQAQAGAAGVVERVGEPHERLKELGLIGRADPLAGISHGDRDPLAVGSPFPAGDDRDGPRRVNLAALLSRLVKAWRKRLRSARIRPRPAAQSISRRLLCSWILAVIASATCGSTAPGQSPRRLHRDLADDDFLIFEDVVGQRQHVIAGPADLVQIGSAGPGPVPCHFEQLAEALDGPSGSAQLVADIGQEIVLATVAAWASSRLRRQLRVGLLQREGAVADALFQLPVELPDGASACLRSVTSRTMQVVSRCCSPMAPRSATSPAGRSSRPCAGRPLPGSGRGAAGQPRDRSAAALPSAAAANSRPALLPWTSLAG